MSQNMEEASIDLFRAKQMLLGREAVDLEEYAPVCGNNVTVCGAAAQAPLSRCGTVLLYTWCTTE
jgi:hypothetical protein